jgi:O-acetyl-ADP-ribose deacetylase (regulator of RNase III)
MNQPAMRIGVDNVQLAIRAALKKAEELKIKTIAIPGMGTGVGGVSENDAARAMINVTKEFEDKFEKIMLIGFNDSLIKAFYDYL